jgi:hypothetical protein
MKTRVRPYEYNYSSSAKFAVEIFDEHDPTRGGGVWVVNTKHRFFWTANWRAMRLARYSLAVKESIKDKFIRRLKDGDENE